MRCCVIAIAGAIACSGKPPPARSAETVPAAPAAGAAAPGDATALDQDLPRLVDRSLVMYQDVAKALAAGGDCAAATGKLRQLAGTYREVVQANAKVLHDGRARQLKAALELHNEDFDRSAQAIVSSPTMSACQADPAFSKAFDELLEAPP